MQDTAKYLVHADIAADGVVERSDVVGAVFGQTEGLLGDELDLRELQDASKVGRIDVDVDSQNGQSFGRITIATSLDQVETAILGAALETIDRVGPCRSTIEVRRIEDVRAARRREVVERAKTLLGEAFEGSMPSSRDLVEEVREAIRVEDITDYEGLPAGPHVADSDAIIVVEGRADVLTLLRYGIKNAVAVEGTSVPDAVAELTAERTVTAFLDGDRGGELIRKELAQVGDVDYVAFAPEGRSVEDLARHEVMAALREKVPYDRLDEGAGADDGDGRPDGPSPSAGGPGVDADRGTGPPAAREPGREGVIGPGGDGGPAGQTRETREAGAGRDPETVDDDGAPTDAGLGTGSAPTADPPTDATAAVEPTNDKADSVADDGADSVTDDGADSVTDDGADSVADDGADSVTEDSEATAADEASGGGRTDEGGPPRTLRGHVREVVGEGSGTVRLLDPELGVIEAGEAGEAFDLAVDAEEPPWAVVVDGELDQRLLDVAAQRGVDHLVGASTGEFVKQPTSVRIRTADQLLAANEA